MPGFNPGITVFEPSPSNIVGVHGLEREHPARSKMLTYAGAVTSGVLAALALQIYLSGAGFELGALWENLLSAKPRELRTTGPWWAIAGMAFVVSGATAAALVRLGGHSSIRLEAAFVNDFGDLIDFAAEEASAYCAEGAKEAHRED